jgi:cation:H+ antiporter
MLLSIAAVFFGIIILIWSADRFVDGASGLARNMGLAPLLVGMLVVGFGTSAPEMLVSSVAALQGNGSLGIGNAIGSNITNIALVLGVTAILTKLPVQSRIVKIEVPLVLASGFLAYALLFFDQHLSRLDGIILFATLIIVMTYLTRLSMRLYREPPSRNDEPLVNNVYDELPPDLPLKSSILWTIVGLILLISSSKILVWGSINIAQAFGVSDLIIGLTIIAIGTSLPELAASISSAKKGETDLAVGNVVGSNLFNTLAVIALPGLLHPDSVPSEALYRDFPIMLLTTILLLVFGIGCWHRYIINRWKGFVLLGIFIAYEILLYFQISQ